MFCEWLKINFSRQLSISVIKSQIFIKLNRVLFLDAYFQIYLHLIFSSRYTVHIYPHFNRIQFLIVLSDTYLFQKMKMISSSDKYTRVKRSMPVRLMSFGILEIWPRKRHVTNYGPIIIEI